MPSLSLRHARTTLTRRGLTGLAVAAIAASGVVLTATPAAAVSTKTWDRLAECESSGNWHIDTGNGYYGGLQFSMSTWRGYGGSGNPAAASKSRQIAIGEKVLRGQGWGAWPSCSAQLGLSGGSSSTSAAHASKQRHHHRVTVSKHTYRVRTGDTLGRIAVRKHVRGGWHRLWDANPQLNDPDVLRVGQRLHLPA